MFRTIFRITKTKHTKKEEKGMLLTLIFAACLVIGILFVVFRNSYRVSIFITQVSFVSIGFFGLLCVGMVILCSHVGVNNQITHNRIEYEAIVAEIQAVNTDNEDVSKLQVIKDVKEWNQDVQNSKYLASNPWTNWFYSQKVVNAMEYIEIPEWDIAVPANIENE
jgi:hypothetical protein